MIRILDRGDGWKVYGEYSDGVQRPIYTGYGPLNHGQLLGNARSEALTLALTDCLDWRRDFESRA